MASTLASWGEVITSSFQELWSGLIGFLPELIGALIVLFVGWIIAILLGKLVTKVLDLIKIDLAVEKLKLKGGFKKIGYDFNVARLVGGLIRWFLILVFIIAAAEILGLSQITSFLTEVALYIPNVIAAVVIMLAAVVIANFAARLIHNSVRLSGLSSANFLATIAKWAIIIFALLAALLQLQVAVSFIQTLFIGVVAMLALAGGLAFGLGGREHANEILTSLRKKVASKKEETLD